MEHSIHAQSCISCYCFCTLPLRFKCIKQTGIRRQLRGAKKAVANTESIAIKLDTYHWKYSKQPCYIGVYNRSVTEVEATLTVNQCREIELMPKEVMEKYVVFNEVFRGVDGGVISQSERNAKKLVGLQYTYGEIELVHFLPLLRMASNRSGGEFWDLGSGTGKALIAASLSNYYSKICGVEILEDLRNTSTSVITKFCKHTKTEPTTFEVISGDMREVDWSDADVVYVASICFSEELVQELAEKGRALKSGTRIVSLKKWIIPEVYNVLFEVKAKMSWGNTGVYIMERI
eukprot:TRINITY_DN2635_c0_g1_i9.p1 TRINITY_DN2635_c0_g1~~TRINITY_DN2635_c0_g1_i9.p1  ORF type:complete len:290 (+),score=13.93 TRINITY_DN2635_c0_g1_i9:689-1558(+)